MNVLTGKARDSDCVTLSISTSVFYRSHVRCRTVSYCPCGLSEVDFLVEGAKVGAKEPGKPE